MEVVYLREPEILDFTLLNRFSVIGIDGDPGAGKSILAKEINAALGGTVVSVDDFLLGNGQPYASQVDLPRVAQIIKGAASPIIIEGILLQDILDRAGVQADFIIFTRRVHDDIQLYGEDAEVEEYYRRRSPWREAQLSVTLRISFRR